MASNNQAHSTGGGIGGKAKTANAAAKRERRKQNLAARADANKGRASSSHLTTIKKK